MDSGELLVSERLWEKGIEEFQCYCCRWVLARVFTPGVHVNSCTPTNKNVLMFFLAQQELIVHTVFSNCQKRMRLFADWATLLTHLAGCCSNIVRAEASSTEPCSVWYHGIVTAAFLAIHALKHWANGFPSPSIPPGWSLSGCVETHHGQSKCIGAFGDASFQTTLPMSFQCILQNLNFKRCVTVQITK